MPSLNSGNYTILGIDPGTHRIGYGAIKTENNKLRLIKYGVIEKKDKGYDCNQLLFIYKKISSLIQEIKPNEIAIEKIFFSKNQKTAMKVAEARGVIILASLEKKINIKEFSPNIVKQAVSGYGSADKKAVLKMVSLILGIKNFNSIDDASDALAVAITSALIRN